MPKKRSSIFRPSSWVRSLKGKAGRRKSSDHYGVVNLDDSLIDERGVFDGNGKNVLLVDPIPLSRTAGDGGGAACVSLGFGEFPMDGPITFHPTPGGSTAGTLWSTMSNCSGNSISEDGEDDVDRRGSSVPLSLRHAGTDLLTVVKSKSKDLSKELKDDLLSVMSAGKDIAGTMAKTPLQFLRKKTLFMRTADLGLLHHDGDHEQHPHYHHPSRDPPPGVDHDPKEAWVALDTGEGSHAPVAPFAIDALAKSGFDSAMNRGMWIPNRATEKLLTRSDVWKSAVWQMSGPVRVVPRGSPDETEVCVWSGNFTHGLYGSDLPTVRAEGIINMAPIEIVKLLLDSYRVHEYNKMSLGRDDVLVLQDDFENDGPFGKSVTKVVRSVSKPPLVRKSMEFVTLMHARKLEDGNGFLIVSRAVTQAEEAINSDGTVMRSEILMGVNIIRNVVGDANRSVMINVNHVRSPMVPMMIAKKIGLTAAVGFFNDLRALC